uniref:GATA-type domain-containing protein n=1 Tax=Ditylenchus dipsaci TaxID=166011 RepID=A0A915DDD7_9BILA
MSSDYSTAASASSSSSSVDVVTTSNLSNAVVYTNNNNSDGYHNVSQTTGSCACFDCQLRGGAQPATSSNQTNTVDVSNAVQSFPYYPYDYQNQYYPFYPDMSNTPFVPDEVDAKFSGPKPEPRGSVSSSPEISTPTTDPNCKCPQCNLHDPAPTAASVTADCSSHYHFAQHTFAPALYAAQRANVSYIYDQAGAKYEVKKWEPSGEHSSSTSPDASNVLSNNSFYVNNPLLVPHPGFEMGSGYRDYPMPRPRAVSHAQRMARTNISCHANSKCVNCGTTETTLWRRSATGEVECNACNLYFRKNNRARPPALQRKGIMKRKRTQRVYQQE